MQRIRRLGRQLGQGMTEYIIIVAVIAIGSIAVYTLYGDVLRNQTAAASVALAGESGEDQMSSARNTALAAGMEAGVGKDMRNFAENPNPHNSNNP
jgi:Tfp pilus assembly protein PilE